MFNYLSKRFTKNYDEIPLFWVTFNLNKYKQNGSRGSCDLKIHPNLKEDEHIKKTLNDLVDYIRRTNNMNDIK